MDIYENASELIGNTPLIKLNSVVDEDTPEILVKLEMFNPGSSVKDRIAYHMVKKAEIRGKLKPGGTIIEPTSGNTGIGLALMGAARGYKVILTMPESMSEERRKLLKALGAELILTPGEQGMNGAIEKATKLSEEKGYYMPQQFKNPANPEIHRRTTAREILKETEGKIDYFVAGVGTGGTITGVGEVLKEENPDVKIIAVEPKESAVLSGNKAGPHSIQGIGAGFVPEILETDLLDDVITITDEEAREMARQMARKEGLLVGISSGAAAAASLKVAKNCPEDSRIVTISPDGGERYLTTELYED